MSLLLRSLFILSMLLLCISCGPRLLPKAVPIDICPDCPQSLVSPAARFGIFSPALFVNYRAEISRLSDTLGIRPGYLLWFMQIDDPFPQNLAQYCDSMGISLVISLNLKSLRLNSTRNDTLLQEIVQGIWDDTLRSFARLAHTFGKTVYLRFGYEMNGNWFEWGEKRGVFTTAWRHAHDIFGQEQALNVRWVFSPAALWDNKTMSADFLPYYPGDSLVDIIGLDGYNFGDNYDRYHYWQDFASIFIETYGRLRQFNKPLWVCETGAPSDSRRAQWLREMFAYLDNNQCLEAVFWFNAYKTGEPDFRLESDSASLNVVRQWLKY